MRRLLPTLPWFLLILFLVSLLLLALLFVRNQWQQEFQIKVRSSERELQLLTSLVRNDLQTGNYQHINELIDEWGRNNFDVKEMGLTSSNGYQFNQFSRSATTSDPVTFTANINYGYRGGAQLKLIKDFIGVQTRHNELAWHIGIAYIIVALLLTALTCALLRYLKKSAALLHEVERRQQAETTLQLQYDRLEEIVANRTAQLAAINSELEAFSYSVSHDLRAPLRAIDGFSMALLEDYGERFDTTGRDYLNRVRNAAQKLGHLIDDLLQLSRVTRSELQLQRVDLSQLAAIIVEELHQSEPERRVNITIAPDLWADGDPTLLQVLLTNLLGNAWKFTRMQQKAIIEFGAHTDPDEKYFFIRDNGVGFDMKYSAKLFTAFQRLHSMQQFEGTGVGLATVQRVINRHGGRIWVEAEIDKGATFYFTLPAAEARPAM